MPSTVISVFSTSLVCEWLRFGGPTSTEIKALSTPGFHLGLLSLPLALDPLARLRAPAKGDVHLLVPWILLVPLCKRFAHARGTQETKHFFLVSSLWITCYHLFDFTQRRDCGLRAT
jgi:hypothetical protein